MISILAAALAAVVALLFVVRGAELAALIAIVGILLMIVPWSLYSAQKAADKQKRKRGLDGLDMYSVIDRLVDELNEDEATYLQQRLGEREAKAKNDLTLTVDELLNQRAQDRNRD